MSERPYEKLEKGLDQIQDQLAEHRALVEVAEGILYEVGDLLDQSVLTQLSNGKNSPLRPTHGAAYSDSTSVANSPVDFHLGQSFENATPNTPALESERRNKFTLSLAQLTPYSAPRSALDVGKQGPQQSHLELEESYEGQPIIQLISREEHNEIDVYPPRNCRYPRFESEEAEEYYRNKLAPNWKDDEDYFADGYGSSDRTYSPGEFESICRGSEESSRISQADPLQKPERSFVDDEDEDEETEEPMTVTNIKVLVSKTKGGANKTALDYKVGQKIGEYEIVSVAGDGTFGRTFACRKSSSNTPPSVCIKMLKNQKMEGVLDGAMAEISILTELRDDDDPLNHRIVRLLECFYYKSTLVLVEELHHDNLYEVLSHFQRENFKYFTVSNLRVIAKQILEPLQYMHAKGVIHADLKPENILLTAPMHATQKPDVVLIDFGSAMHAKQRSVEWYVQTRPYRAPEVILGAKFSTQMDMWSLGAILCELYQGDLLFTNKTVQRMLAQIIGICGPLPQWMMDEGERTKDYFKGEFLYEWVELPQTEDHPPEFVVKLLFPKPTSLRDRIHCTDELFLDFVEKLLVVDPSQRMTAEDAMRHPWLMETE